MRLLSLALGLLALAGPAVAQLQNPTALRLSAGDAAPVIDGRLDDPVWQRAPVYDRFVQFLPEDKKPARWRTTVQIVVTEDALVFGIRAYDPDPSRIRAPLTRRDQVRRDQDFVAVLIDPVGQRRSAQYARVNAAGVIGDGLFTAADDGEDPAPDFDLQAATARLPDGYSVELRWPLAALRFPHSGGAPWRVMVSRSIPRDEATLNVSAPALSKDALTFIAELQPLDGLGDLVEQVRERSFVTVRPELTLRATKDSDADGTRRSRKASLGAELKWRPRADWVIDATLNPDFSQVELNAPQLAGNTRFALSVPEKRPFFLESADLVGQTQPDDSGQNQSLAAFYTRAITDPGWGVRASWRGAQAEGTLLSLRDSGGGVLLRAGAFGTGVFNQPRDSQASFARGRLQMGDLGLAGLATLRNFGGGRSTQVIGSDFVWSAGESGQWRGHVLASSTTLGFDDQGRPRRIDAQNGHRAWLAWRHRDADWGSSVNIEEVSPRFANDNGFVSQSAYRRASVFGYGRLGARKLAGFDVYEFEPQLKLQQTQTVNDPLLGVPGGQVVERLVQPGFWFSAARNTGVWAHLGLDAHRSRSGGALHPTRTVLVGFESNPGETWSFLSAEVEWGRRLDVEADRVGTGAQAQTEAKWRLELPAGLWLELEQRLGLGFVNDREGRRAFSDRSAQSLAVLHLSPRDSLRLIAQQLRFSRREELALGLAGVNRQTRHLSAMLQHRVGLARVISLGLTRANEHPGGVQANEIFFKAALGY